MAGCAEQRKSEEKQTHVQGKATCLHPLVLCRCSHHALQTKLMNMLQFIHHLPFTQGLQLSSFLWVSLYILK